jgi:hypothetical protein
VAEAPMTLRTKPYDDEQDAAILDAAERRTGQYAWEHDIIDALFLAHGGAEIKYATRRMAIIQDWQRRLPARAWRRCISIQSPGISISLAF